mgnify:CR=1 FL=1
MKKLIVLLVMMCGLVPVLRAADGCNQRLSPAEFRAKQKAYITEKAGLTKEEAVKFFPLYFELQDKKKEQNDKAWKLIRQGKDEKTTEAQYDAIMEGVYDAREVQEDIVCQETLSGAESRNALSPGIAERHAS